MSEICNLHIERKGIGRTVVSPHLFQDCSAFDNRAGITGQECQDFRLPEGQAACPSVESESGETAVKTVLPTVMMC